MFNSNVRFIYIIWIYFNSALATDIAICGKIIFLAGLNLVHVTWKKPRILDEWDHVPTHRDFISCIGVTPHIYHDPVILCKE